MLGSDYSITNLFSQQTFIEGIVKYGVACWGKDEMHEDVHERQSMSYSTVITVVMVSLP